MPSKTPSTLQAFLTIACFLLIVLQPTAKADTDTGTDTQGKQLYSSCISCHGAKAEGNPALQSPALNGQTADYLIRQLQHFKSGLRGSDSRDSAGAQMRAMTAALPDEQAVQAVAEYIASLPLTFPDRQTAPTGDLKNGNNVYQGNCGSCHGGQAEGNPMLKAPRLAGLDAAYMTRQYQHFVSGLRGSDPQDRYGRQMQFMAKNQPSEKDLRDVIAHIYSLARE